MRWKQVARAQAVCGQQLAKGSVPSHRWRNSTWRLVCIGNELCMCVISVVQVCWMDLTRTSWRRCVELGPVSPHDGGGGRMWQAGYVCGALPILLVQQECAEAHLKHPLWRKCCDSQHAANLQRHNVCVVVFQLLEHQPLPVFPVQELRRAVAVVVCVPRS